MKYDLVNYIFKPHPIQVSKLIIICLHHQFSLCVKSSSIFILTMRHETYLLTELRHPKFSHDTLIREIAVSVNKVSLNDVMILRILPLDFFLQLRIFC